MTSKITVSIASSIEGPSKDHKVTIKAALELPNQPVRLLTADSMRLDAPGKERPNIACLEEAVASLLSQALSG